MDKNSNLKTTIGLEIHVQLATKSKMFCGCDNDAQGKEPNSVVCPVCLGMPGALPVANCQAIEWTIKTGLALNCEIPKIAKFDRKHYFYPDLPKGYQISQYDEPFCKDGHLEVLEAKIRLNRIHLEEDAGKLIHKDGKSLVDLNRAGTPLMEIVTEPDITSPTMAGEFLRRLQKIVRDEVQVSEASMEKGHMRCDANISVTDGDRMSQIIEIKNINSFKFVEKALAKAEEKLREEYENWPDKLSKETWGYDSVKDSIYLQRKKEESADYRYFPEPDLPPFDSTEIDMEKLKSETTGGEGEIISRLTDLGIILADAKALAADKLKMAQFEKLRSKVEDQVLLAKVIVHNYFGTFIKEIDDNLSEQFGKAINALGAGKISKQIFAQISDGIINAGKNFEEILSDLGGEQSSDESDIEKAIIEVLDENPAEVNAYKDGKTALYGFFVGQVMKRTGGRANPQIINKILKEKL